MTTDSEQLPDKPRPQPGPETAPWWQALTEHRLVAQRCSDCGNLRLYPRPMCDQCYSLNYDWADLSGTGTVHSWSTAHHAFNPGFKRDLPYLNVTVDLQEGLRLLAPLQGVSDDEVHVGMSVVVDFEDVDDSYTRLRFKRAE